LSGTAELIRFAYQLGRAVKLLFATSRLGHNYRTTPP